ncbi:MAG: hypothetical protein HYU28_02620 [Actinobacteria bacterium]|nr:hypothetical protein [Actinomycetota bacterium]
MTRGVPAWLRSLAERAGRDRPIAVAVALSVALVAVGLATVVIRNRGNDLAPGQARMAAEGVVEASFGGADFTEVEDEATLSRGDRVRVKSGRAALEFAGGMDAELRTGSAVTVGGAEGAVLRLDRGDLLVEASDSGAVVDGESAHVTVKSGASKLRRSASLVLGVYDGDAVLVGAGRSLAVDRYRQAAVVGQGRLPRETRPLVIDEGDEWDRRFLGSVLELDRRLVAFGRGFEVLLPDEGSGTPSLYRRLLPSLEGEPLTAPLLAGRSAGENLIGLALVALGEGAFQERFDAVFDFRDAGARWGLVAADLGYEAPDVVAAVEAAIDRAPLPVAVPEGPVAAPGAEGPSSGGGTPSRAGAVGATRRPRRRAGARPSRPSPGARPRPPARRRHPHNRASRFPADSASRCSSTRLIWKTQSGEDPGR